MSFNRFIIVLLVLFSTTFHFNPGPLLATSLRSELGVQASQDPEAIQKIEDFLSQEAAGLNMTYRQFFDKMIEEGFQVYLMGGLIRDVLSDSGFVKDVDYNFIGKKEDLIKFFKKNKWEYVSVPESSIVTVGSREDNPHPLEGYSTDSDYIDDLNNFDFTMNGIFYDLNTKTFLAGFDLCLADIQNKRLRVLASDWEIWLKSKNTYRKVIRFWKMVGKGYIYPADLEQLVKKTIEEGLQKEPDLFNEEIIRYFGSHYSSMDEIVRGCKATMGLEWFEENILSKGELFQDKHRRFEEKQVKYTFKPSVNY